MEVVGSFPATEPEPVVTTIDPALQAAAETALAGVAVPAAFVVVDAATGEVRASVARPLVEASTAPSVAPTHRVPRSR